MAKYLGREVTVEDLGNPLDENVLVVHKDGTKERVKKSSVRFTKEELDVILKKDQAALVEAQRVLAAKEDVIKKEEAKPKV